MAHKRVEEQHIRDMMELGTRNAALIPRVQRWCEHLQVEMVSSGLLAEMSGLPVGRMAIHCDHAKGMSIQAMQFDQVAACFVTENCRNCLNHQELHPDNAGREILREADKVQEEEKTAKPLSAAARRVRGLVNGDLSTALVTAPTTEQSVLECVARLEMPEQSSEAAKLLRQAAELAPEFFNDLACEVIAEHIPELIHGGDCVETLRIIGRKQNALPASALRAAQHCVETELCPDEVHDLLADHYDGGGELPPAPTVARIVRHHGYRQVNSIHSEPEANPGQLRALLAIGRRDLDLLADAVNRLLEEPDPRVRIAAPVAVSALLEQLPQLGPLVTDRLIRSLELDDNRDYGESVDVRARDALGEIFAFFPARTRFQLETAAAVASNEGKELLMKVYGRLARAADEKEASLRRDRAMAALPEAIDALLAAVTDDKRLLDVRREASDTLSHIAWNQPGLMVARLDSLLGALALVLNEQVKFEQANPGGDPALPGFPREETTKYTSISAKLIEAVERLISTAPDTVFQSAVQMLRTLNSKHPEQQALKWHLVGLFERLARDHATGPRVVPPLYNALMDFESVSVRARALGVIENMLGSADELVPDNMREMVMIYLTDSYVAIHQAAARAARYLQPPTIEKAEEMLQALHAQFRLYRRRQEDHQHLDAIVKSAVGICRHYPQLFPTHALPLLLVQSRSKNAYYARDALEEWRRYAPKSNVGDQMYVREVLGHFGRCPPDRDQWRPHDSAHRLFLSLFEASRPAIVANLAAIQTTVAALVKPAPFEAIQFVALLLHHEQYTAAETDAQVVAQSLLPGAYHDHFRDLALLCQAMAAAEASIAQGQCRQALNLLTAEQSRLQSHVPNEDRNDPKAFIRSLSVADKVARRLR